MAVEPDPAARPKTSTEVLGSIRDPLTGLFSRRYFEASLEREVHRMERRNLPLGIVLLEVDGFEGWSEARAREVAEALLRAVGALLNRRVRSGDVASRYDRAIFALMLPEAPLEGVRTRAEQLRSAVKELRSGGISPGTLTFSLGVAAFPDCGHSSGKLLQAVKAALDQSRTDGGDRVTIAPSVVLDRRLMLPD